MFTNDGQEDWSPRALTVFRQNFANYTGGLVDNDDPAESFAAIVDRWQVAHKLLACCESPIEEIMAGILPFVLDDYGYLDFACSSHKGFGSFVTPQAQLGDYRVDFLITCEWGGFNKSIAIECDGHDYHDRTKQQVARDKARDRKMTTSVGVSVLRYSGYELYRDPSSIGAEIERTVSDLLHSVGVDAGAVRPRKKPSQ